MPDLPDHGQYPALDEAGPRPIGWTIAAGGVAALLIASVAFWLRSRGTQPEIDAETAERLAPQRRVEEPIRPSAADIVVGS